MANDHGPQIKDGEYTKPCGESASKGETPQLRRRAHLVPYSRSPASPRPGTM